MKKQRSASPSQAMPRSARSLRTLSITNVRFSGRSGFGSWSGNAPSGAQYVGTSSSAPSCSRIGPTIGPAMPLPPSSTTFSGRIAAGSTNSSARAWNAGYTSTSSALPAGPSGAGSPAATSAAMSPIPASPDSASAPSRTSFAPV